MGLNCSEETLLCFFGVFCPSKIASGCCALKCDVLTLIASRVTIAELHSLHCCKFSSLSRNWVMSKTLLARTFPMDQLFSEFELFNALPLIFRQNYFSRSQTARFEVKLSFSVDLSLRYVLETLVRFRSSSQNNVDSRDKNIPQKLIFFVIKTQRHNSYAVPRRWSYQAWKSIERFDLWTKRTNKN